MKKYLVSATVIFWVMFSNAQKGFGFDIGVSTSKAPMVDVKYFLNENAFSLGVSYKIFNDALGKKSNELKPATHSIGDGYYFLSVDVAYTRIINEKFSVSGEISIAKRTHYQNLGYDSSPDGNYHRTLNTLTIGGAGARVTFNANDVLGFFAGYNSIRELGVGVQLKFVH